MPRRLPPLRSLRAFEAAARHLSFARAAEELHVTPAAISQQIKVLEDHLGITLFRRGTGVTLTEPAATVLPAVIEAFDRLEAAMARLRAGRQSGPLVVAAPPSFAARWLIPRLAEFERLHPELDLRLSASTRLVDFTTEDVDVAIRYGGGSYGQLHSERLSVERVAVVTSPELAATLKTLADLPGVPLLHNEGMEWDPTFPDWRAWLRQAGIGQPPQRLRPFGDATLLIEAARAGLGVALVWESLVAAELRDGHLVSLFDTQPLASAYHLVCPADHLSLGKVRAFREWIVGAMAPLPPRPADQPVASGA